MRFYNIPLRRITLLIVFIILLIGSVIAKEHIQIPYGIAPNIDGVVGANEWDGAEYRHILINGGNDSIKVSYLHDSSTLYLLYTGKLESANSLFPELLLDIDNDSDSTWDEDDKWFHVSATDCDYSGEHSIYDSCQEVRPQWLGVNNFKPGGKKTDTVEISIPLDYLGININTVDSIGLSFEVTNTFNTWNHWPSTATIDKPNTWAKATFEHPPVMISNRKTRRTSKVNFISAYPNPTAGSFTFRIANDVKDKVTGLWVSNLMGDIIYKRAFGEQDIPEEIRMNLVGLPKGIYLYGLNMTDREIVKKLVVR